MSFTVTPRVIDLSHHNVVETLDGAIKAGIWGIIHKATEGHTVRDVKYETRRDWAKEKALLWGAYHFVRPGTVVSQVEFFLNIAKPDDQTLLALDWEVSSVDLDFVIKWLKECERRTKRKAVLYSGHTAREALERRNSLSDSDKAYLGSHRLWHAQYSKLWTISPLWEKPWLWQYSGDGLGPLPHGVEGIKIAGKEICDMNSYEGDRVQLTKEWSGLEVKSMEVASE